MFVNYISKFQCFLIFIKLDTELFLNHDHSKIPKSETQILKMHWLVFRKIKFIN